MGIELIFDWLVQFFDTQFLTLFAATLILFLLMFVTWWVYKKLSTRNIFILFTKTAAKPNPTAWDHFTYIMKYFLLFPLLTFMGFIIFSFSLFLLAKPSTAEAQAAIIFAAITIVSTIRIGAYVHEGLAEDLAKLIPLSMLVIILADPTLHNVGISWAQIAGFILLIPSFLKYLVFTVILEGALRGGTWLIGNLNTEEKDPGYTGQQ
jgi:hypothetical protein